MRRMLRRLSQAYGQGIGAMTVRLRCYRAMHHGVNSKSWTADSAIPTYGSGVYAALPKVPYENYLLWRRVAKRVSARFVRGQVRLSGLSCARPVYKPL